MELLTISKAAKKLEVIAIAGKEPEDAHSEVVRNLPECAVKPLSSDMGI